MMIEQGFYTALGTPLGAEGQVLTDSLAIQVKQQISAGASGLFLLGSMGMQPAVAPSETFRASEAAAWAVKGRCPLFVGVMDNSIAGVMSRVDSISKLAVDGVVLTAPYFLTAERASLMRFFTAVADRSSIPLYLYDLPGVTNTKITFDMALELSAHPNIRGIKTADLTMILQLTRAGLRPDRFTALYSGLDTVDVAYSHGVDRYLDGMFACTPKNARAMQRLFASGDIKGGAAHLQRILALRAMMVKFGVLASFTYLMNLRGMPGSFMPDYAVPVGPEAEASLGAKFAEIGEIQHGE